MQFSFFARSTIMQGVKEISTLFERKAYLQKLTHIVFSILSPSTNWKYTEIQNLNIIVHCLNSLRSYISIKGNTLSAAPSQFSYLSS